MEFTRDLAMYAAIFGFFGVVWFGWAQEKPPKSWRTWLGVGSVASAAITVLGLYLAITNWGAATALTREASITFGIVVGLEFAIAGIGAAVISKRKPQYIPAWIALVVGAHFLPLAWIFKDSWLYLLTALACAAPVAAVLLAKKNSIAVSALTGALMGTVLLAFALRGLYLFFS